MAHQPVESITRFSCANSPNPIQKQAAATTAEDVNANITHYRRLTDRVRTCPRNVSGASHPKPDGPRKIACAHGMHQGCYCLKSNTRKYASRLSTCCALPIPKKRILLPGTTWPGALMNARNFSSVQTKPAFFIAAE